MSLVTLYSIISPPPGEAEYVKAIRYAHIAMRLLSYFLVMKCRAITDCYLFLDSLTMLFLNLNGSQLIFDNNAKTANLTEFYFGIIITCSITMVQQLLATQSWVIKIVFFWTNYAGLVITLLHYKVGKAFYAYLYYYFYVNLLYTIVILFYEKRKMESFLEIFSMRLQQIEHLNEVNRFKDIVLASVSHDLKTPIFSTRFSISSSCRRRWSSPFRSR